MVDACMLAAPDQIHSSVQRFRGGLVLKAHKLLYHSTLGLRVVNKLTGILKLTLWARQVGAQEWVAKLRGLPLPSEALFLSLPHTHTHTRTKTHTISLPHALYLSLSHTHDFSLSRFLSHTQTVVLALHGFGSILVEFVRNK